MAVILGIDPGSNLTGYGLIESRGQQHRLIDCGRLALKGTQLAHRLHQLFEDLRALLAKYKPDEGAVERVFMSRYPDSALKLGQARGAAIVTLAQAGVDVAEYAPREIKQAVASYGGASKEQMRLMVSQLLKLDSRPSADAADALAVAICHAHNKFNPLIKRQVQ